MIFLWKFGGGVTFPKWGDLNSLMFILHKKIIKSASFVVFVGVNESLNQSAHSEKGFKLCGQSFFLVDKENIMLCGNITRYIKLMIW